VFSAQVITAPGRPETTPLGPAKSVIHASRKDTTLLVETPNVRTMSDCRHAPWQTN